MSVSKITGKKFELDKRRAVYIDITDVPAESTPISKDNIKILEKYSLWYRTLCAILFNFVPTSGHPGGSVSSGNIVASALLETMDYEFSNPERLDNDLISYAAGHKALGLYAMWATRNEMIRIGNPELLPAENMQLRLEDMLGFRRNPTQGTPLFKKFNAKPLDGHPTPLVPFLKIATGASGVGVPASFGLAFGAIDRYGKDGPLVHVIEGEGGLTAGRTSEALATAATAQLKNIICHIDWNQAAIDSDNVCRKGDQAGDYVQWNPMEYFYLHDWNVIWVPDGFDFEQILRAQQIAKKGLNNQPTAIIYHTVKGWRYGIEGRKSHGAGHKFCSDEYYNSLKEFEDCFKIQFSRFKEENTPDAVEQNFYDTLMTLRKVAETDKEMADYVTKQIEGSHARLNKLNRKPRPDVPNLKCFYESKEIDSQNIPAELTLKPESSTTLRGELGKTLGYLNKYTNGAFVGGSADLYGSTSINKIASDFPDGFFNVIDNPNARLIAVGGICEDAMGAFMTGISSYGNNIGVSSSYAAFIAALEHIPARLHCISQQAREMYNGSPHQTFIMICGHAGLKTGEDGPTHADPQALQLLQENFPRGKAITLVPWDPQELWPLVVESLKKRPALLAPFVTRPNEKVFDREKIGLPPATTAVEGVYLFRKSDPSKSPYHGTVILQGSDIANDFVSYVLPKMDAEKLNLNVYYVASTELFDLLPQKRQDEILPEHCRQEAMGFTGFTLPTMYRWIASKFGKDHSLHSFSRGIYPGSGMATQVLHEVGLNGPAQWAAIQKYIKDRG